MPSTPVHGDPPARLAPVMTSRRSYPCLHYTRHLNTRGETPSQIVPDFLSVIQSKGRISMLTRTYRARQVRQSMKFEMMAVVPFKPQAGGGEAKEADGGL